MYALVLTFREIEDIDPAVRYLRDNALPILGLQRGYQGVQAGTDRAGRLLGVLSRWATEADRLSTAGGGADPSSDALSDAFGMRRSDHRFERR